MSAAPLALHEYRALVEAAPIMIWRAGADAQCNYVNDAWLAFTGRSFDEVRGYGWMDIVHPDDRERGLAHYLAHFRERAPFELEYRLRRHDGVYRWMFDRGVPLHTDGQFAGYIGGGVEIEGRRQAEAQRQGTLSAVAHELRTPLAALQTYLDVIRTRGRFDAAIFDRIGRQIRRFSRLIDDLSDTAHLQEGRSLRVTKEPVDLGLLVRRLAASAAELAPLRNPPVRFEASLPAGEYRVLGDLDRLEQVLINVLDNAFKFSPQDGLVTMDLSRNSGDLALHIRDHGIGIPPDELDQVTRPYYRASNVPRSRYPGAGMGLALSRELIEQHGGKLSIASQLDGGTEVTLTLPEAA